jgi:serine/threonine protein kinase HipA of HipAB toxin-antitoxin module
VRPPRIARATPSKHAGDGLVYTKGDGLCYVVRRFDRVGRSEKLAVEDLAQLLGLERETKYDATRIR